MQKKGCIFEIPNYFIIIIKQKTFNGYSCQEFFENHLHEIQQPIQMIWIEKKYFCHFPKNYIILLNTNINIEFILREQDIETQTRSVNLSRNFSIVIYSLP